MQADRASRLAPASVVRVVVSDVDGTLVDPNSRVPAPNVEALAAASARGVRIVLATIRKRDTAEQIVAQLGMPCALACEGGATTYDTDGALVRRVTLPWDVAVAIATLADERQFPLATTVDTVNYYGPGYEPNALLGAVSHAVPRNQDALVGPPTRMVVRAADALEFIVQAFADAPLHIVRHYRADGSFIDGVITHAEATKAHGIAALLQRWALDWDSVMAIGDAEADLGMIQRARLGVAVANATLAVQAAADYVSASAAESGVAQAIERYVLAG
jgi:hypothetical protein